MLTITQVDAFTAEPFGGNPAAVCLLPEPADEPWMQRVAREINLSETAFLVRRDDGAFDLRWFTPTVEIDLCGHGTLASAHVLWEDGRLEPTAPAIFHTLSGPLTAIRRDDWIEMDFPAEPDEPASAPEWLAAALSAEPTYIGRNRFDFLIEVDAEATLRHLTPDLHRLRDLGVRGVIVTALAETDGFDFVSRFFAPATGIDEDPVTGSAHCCLAPYWQRRLGQDSFTAWQASQRGGVVRCAVRDDRVLLCGQAVTVLRAKLLA